MLHIKVRLATVPYPAQTKPYMAEKKAHIQTAVYRVSYSITQKLWHLSGLQPITLLNTTLVPKKSACFLQHTGCDIDNSSISSLHSQGTQQSGQVMYSLSKQVGRVPAHRIVCPHLSACKVLMQHTK